MNLQYLYLILSAFLIVVSGVVDAEVSPEIGSPCEFNSQCDEGICVAFPEIGKRCAQPEPCSYFNCSEILEGSFCVFDDVKFDVFEWNKVSCVGNCESDKDCNSNEICDPLSPLTQVGECKILPTPCPDTYAPVCGADDITYPNDCNRMQNKITKNHNGPCLEGITSIPCGPNVLVSGECNPQKYESCISFPGIGFRCTFQLPGVELTYPCPIGLELRVFNTNPSTAICEGSCKANADCGSTDYANYGCLLTTKECNPNDEECPPFPRKTIIVGRCVQNPRPCENTYFHVCGTDGKTYRNQCELIEAGAVLHEKGECGGDQYITNFTCDAIHTCHKSLGCFGFPGIGLRCAKPDPCSYYKCPEGTECTVTASYPGQIVCSCVGSECPSSSGDDDTISYDLLTQTEIRVIKPDGQKILHNISLFTPGNKGATPRVKGILKSTTVSAKYSNELVVEDSELFMQTSAGKKQINVMPEDAVSISETPDKKSFKKIELNEDQNRPIYSIKGESAGKIIGIFSTTLEVETKVSAEKGNIISVHKPWWSFLVW